MLGLWLRRLLLLLWLSSLWLGGRLWLLLLGSSLLLWWLVGDGLLNEVKLVGDSGVDGLVVDSLVPTGDVGVVGAPLLVEEELETTGDQANHDDIGKSGTLADEVCVDHEVLLKDVDGTLGALLGVIDGLLVVWVAANEGTEPTTKAGKDLRVAEGHPSEDGSVVLLGLAEESGLLVLGGHYGDN